MVDSVQLTVYSFTFGIIDIQYVNVETFMVDSVH